MKEAAPDVVALCLFESQGRDLDETPDRLNSDREAPAVPDTGGRVACHACETPRAPGTHPSLP